jgi:hypothetical protein
MDGSGYRVVADSVQGPVEHVPLNGVAGFQIQARGLTTAHIYPVRIAARSPLQASARCVIGDQVAWLASGTRTWLRRGWDVAATLGGVEYRLHQTGPWSAVLLRADEPIARLRRRPRGRRSVTWTEPPAGSDELTLCHALAGFAGIGAPGLVQNGLHVASPWFDNYS